MSVAAAGPALPACILAGVVLALTAAAANADRITVVYTARAATVAQAPFGLAVPLDTPVSGFFTYNTETEDLEPDDPFLGEYQHETGAGFLAEFLTTRISGSTTPFYQVDIDVNPAIDTFRVWDGPRGVGNQGGIMSIDDAEDEDIEMFLAVTGDAFDSDDLINPFPAYTFGPLGTPHTFTLKDDQGTMLLQFLAAEEAVCGDPGGGGVTAGDALQVLRTAVGSRPCLPCLCDVDDNGKVTSSDALKTLRHAVGGMPSLDCAPCL
ncbi:MAG: hypothetical protein ABR538_13860 [Candidatus Binatia bacterium]